jgi:protein disulfide-isomerase A6
MKPAWDQLGDEYSSSSSVIVADVDCTVEQDLCSNYDVKGYPTIKYFTAETDAKGADYSGGRSFDDLKQFVSDELEVKCLLSDTAGCSEKEVEFMGKWKAKPKADVSAQLERLSKMMGSSMAPDLKKWVAQRANILKQLSEA